MTYGNIFKKVTSELFNQGIIAKERIEEICGDQDMPQLIIHNLLKLKYGIEKEDQIIKNSSGISQASMPDLFFSYAHKDNLEGKIDILITKILIAYFKRYGKFLTVFYDTDSLYGGFEWEFFIKKSLETSKVFVPVLSPNYFESELCNTEWDIFMLQKERWLFDFIIPVDIKYSELIESDKKSHQEKIQTIERLQIIDFSDWFQLEELPVKDLNFEAKIQDFISGLEEKLKEATRKAEHLNQSNIPPISLNSIYRREYSQFLRQTFNQSDPPTVVLSGIPGIGKRSIAYQYARSEISNYKGGCWVIDVDEKINTNKYNQESDLKDRLEREDSAKDKTYERIIIGLLGTLSNAEILPFNENEKLNLKLAKQGIKNHFGNIILNKDENRVLFVFENVKNPYKFGRDKLMGILPKDAHVIVTSNICDTINTDNIYWTRIDPLDLGEAKQLLKNYHPWSNDLENTVTDIVKRIGGFTLGINMVGAFIQNRNSIVNNSIGYDEILVDLQNEGLEIYADGNLYSENNRNKSQHYNNFTSWLLDKIWNDLENHEKTALKLASEFKIETIPFQWIEDVIKTFLPNLFTKKRESLPSLWDKSLKKIYQFSIWRKAASSENFRMHLILQDIINKKFVNDYITILLMSKCLRNHVNTMFDELNYADNQLNSFHDLITNRDFAIQDFIIPLNKVVILLMDRGQMKKADEILERALDYFHNQPPSETELILSTCYNFRAQIRALQGKYSEARKYYLMAIGISLHSKEHKNDVFMHSVSLTDMESAALINRGESSANYSFVNRIKIFGKKYMTENYANHLRVIAINLKNEAMDYVEQNKYSTNFSFYKDNLFNALNCIKKSISIVKEDPYSKDLEYQFRIDFCRLLRQMGNFDEAIFELEKAKNLMMAINETNSIMYMYYLEKALVLKEQKYLEKALKNCEEARLLVEKEFGRDSDQYTKCLVVGNEINLLAHLKNRVEFGLNFLGTTITKENIHDPTDLKNSEK